MMGAGRYIVVGGSGPWLQFGRFGLDDGIKHEMTALAPQLLRFARSLSGSAADAEDLVQATYERAITNLDKWTPGTRLDSWMYRIAQNLSYTNYRSAKTRQAKLTLVADMAPTAEDGEATALAKLQHQAVADAMNNLPAEQRTALLLVAVEGRSYQEIAEITGASVAAVTSRVARARETLRKEVGR